MEDGKKKQLNPDRTIQIIILIITLISLILAILSLVGQQKDSRLLQSIVYNTYSPNPYLNVNANCYTMEQDSVQKYFGESHNYAGYVDVFELKVINMGCTNPWMKITLPEGISPINVTTIPEANIEFFKDEYEKNKIVISVQWQKELSPAEESIKLLVLYNKKDLAQLESQNRIYSYGMKESSESRGYLGCYNLKIFPDF